MKSLRPKAVPPRRTSAIRPSRESPGWAIERQNLAHQVYARIKSLILSGRLAGGQRVPEETLAAEFGVSRTPVREALRRLEEYGLVRIKPRSYAEVVQLNAEEARDVVEVRGAVERLAVQRLAKRATKEDLEVLRGMARECRRLLARGDVGAMFDQDSRLHLELARRSGNRALYEVLERLDVKVQLVRLVRCTNRQAIAPMLQQHERILEAVAAHDAEAAGRLMGRHVEGPPENRR